MSNNTIAIAFLLLIIFSLQACAPIIIAGAASGVSVANDRRSSGTIVDDQGIESKASFELNSDKELRANSHLSVISYNKVVLVIGQVANQRLHDRAISKIRQLPNVKKVHDEISIGTATSLKTRSNDAWITTRVKTAMIRDTNLNALRIKVITENSLTYLMGMVSRAEANVAVKVAQQIKGVRGVVKVFEYIEQ